MAKASSPTRISEQRLRLRKSDIRPQVFAGDKGFLCDRHEGVDPDFVGQPTLASVDRASEHAAPFLPLAIPAQMKSS